MRRMTLRLDLKSNSQTALQITQGGLRRSDTLGAPDRSVAINNTLAIERRGGRSGGGGPMLVRSFAQAAALSCL